MIQGHDETRTPGQIAASGVSADVKVRSVTQSLIAISIVATLLYLYVAHQNAPDGLVGISGGVVGWYFRGVIANPDGTTRP